VTSKPFGRGRYLKISSAQQGCIYLIKNTQKTVILGNVMTI